jgi:retron-type reverse transcriptase
MENLVSGYEKLKNSVSTGVDGIQKFNFKQSDFDKLYRDLKLQKYKPKANKRVGIPKADGGTRYLGIASTRDKIVQATVKNLLGPILEPKFSKFSYGFRPKIGCHHALFQIRHG